MTASAAPSSPSRSAISSPEVPYRNWSEPNQPPSSTPDVHDVVANQIEGQPGDRIEADVLEADDRGVLCAHGPRFEHGEARAHPHDQGAPNEERKAVQYKLRFAVEGGPALPPAKRTITASAVSPPRTGVRRRTLWPRRSLFMCGNLPVAPRKQSAVTAITAERGTDGKLNGDASCRQGIARPLTKAAWLRDLTATAAHRCGRTHVDLDVTTNRVAAVGRGDREPAVGASLCRYAGLTRNGGVTACGGKPRAERHEHAAVEGHRTGRR